MKKKTEIEKMLEELRNKLSLEGHKLLDIEKIAIAAKIRALEWVLENGKEI
jgi:hypothetical protein